VVARGEGQLASAPPRKALELDCCNEGDVIVADSFGRLRCHRSVGSSASRKE